MKNWFLVLICLAAGSALAISPDEKAAAKPVARQEQAKKNIPDKPATKKHPGIMEKAGSSVKSGWNKFTHNIKQGAKKPACNDAQRSMSQCK